MVKFGHQLQAGSFIFMPGFCIVNSAPRSASSSFKSLDCRSFRLLAAPANYQFCSSPHDMFSQFSPTLRMSIAALTFIVLLFITGGGDSAVHEQVAAPPSGSGKPSFKGGFSLPIIHRNDPRSPIRDPTVTTLDLFKEEIQLALSPMPADDALASDACPSPFPPWSLSCAAPHRWFSRPHLFECSPCYACARGHYPLYNPSKSSTFRSVFCDDPLSGREDGDQALSYLRFGSQAQLLGKRIPFWKFEDGYKVYLNRVTYQHGNRLTQQQPVPIFPGDEANAKSKAKMVVASGTMGLWLPDYIFYPLLKKIEVDISLTRVLFDDNPNAYCYIGDMADAEQVSVTLGFVGGAEMLLSGDSLFFEYNGNLICLGATRQF
ncbi:unnamed protein product [Miscanthus lutarioriparius]|uniref:Xylanase inhibitor C-terminal domain-containing protein n=1 Tax=Miscanthus lutarioriparius TaxID=422564 RepID=A0A811NSL9_9POAL|nr:unnamed protein product [Miscanthus lutarioriparius]